MRLQPLALAEVVLAASGCSGTTSPPTIPPPKSIDDLYRNAEGLVRKGRHADITLLLKASDAGRLVEAEVSARDTPRYLAVAEEDLFIPGVPLEVASQVRQDRSFVEIPGLGDDSFVPNADRDALFEAANELATAYNVRLLQLQCREAKPE